MDSTLADAPDDIDEPALDRMKMVAKLMDSAVPVPGTSRSVGLDPLLAVVPYGEVVSAAVSAYVVVEAANLGVSYGTLIRMLANVAADSLIGAVPVVGPVLTALWKANERNVQLVIDHLWAESERRRREESDAVTIEIE
jgi:hypothetical protein